MVGHCQQHTSFFVSQYFQPLSSASTHSRLKQICLARAMTMADHGLQECASKVTVERSVQHALNRLRDAGHQDMHACMVYVVPKLS